MLEADETKGVTPLQAFIEGRAGARIGDTMGIGSITAVIAPGGGFSITGSTAGALRQKWTAADGYQCLADVLQRAHDQAAYGKGAERHANGKPFDKQPLRDLIRLHGVGFATGQASKKASEALRLPTVERQVMELLGAVVYLCGAINAIESGEK